LDHKIDIRGYATRSKVRLSRNLKNRSLLLLLLLIFATISYKRRNHQYAINGKANYNVSSNDNVTELLNQPLYTRVICPTIDIM